MGWDDVSRWQPVDLAAAFKMGDAVQPVDVRVGWRSADQKIKGALRVDPMEFASQVPGLPEGRELIFYCDKPGEAQSLTVAMWAFDNGRSRVGVLVGGWDAWSAAGYPVEPLAG
jgi:rhodanese-related sulfurtransferase